MSKQERRRFSREFKLSAVSRLEAGESGMRQVETDYASTPPTISLAPAPK